MKEVFTLDFYGRKLSIETGEIAKQAGGSVLVRYEDTVVLSTACASNQAKDSDFFPLTVSFEEKLYSVGKIPGGFLRREGKNYWKNFDRVIRKMVELGLINVKDTKIFKITDDIMEVVKAANRIGHPKISENFYDGFREASKLS